MSDPEFSTKLGEWIFEKGSRPLVPPHGVTIGPGGILHIAAGGNNRLLKIVP